MKSALVKFAATAAAIFVLQGCSASPPAQSTAQQTAPALGTGPWPHTEEGGYEEAMDRAGAALSDAKNENADPTTIAQLEANYAAARAAWDERSACDPCREDQLCAQDPQIAAQINQKAAACHAAHPDWQ